MGSLPNIFSLLIVKVLALIFCTGSLLTVTVRPSKVLVLSATSSVVTFPGEARGDASKLLVLQAESVAAINANAIAPLTLRDLVLN